MQSSACSSSCQERRVIKANRETCDEGQRQKDGKRERQKEEGEEEEEEEEEKENTRRKECNLRMVNRITQQR